MATVKKNIKKVQAGGSLSNIYTGPAKTNPGVLKAKADKAKADSSVKAYKAKSDSMRQSAVTKAKAKVKMKSGGKMTKKCKYGCK